MRQNPSPQSARSLNRLPGPGLKALVAALCSAALLSGCWLDGPASGPDGSPTGASVASAGISGIAYLGPIVGGTAKLYEVAANGDNGTLLETVATTATGYVFTKSPVAVGRICVSGGSYVDEATGDTKTNTNTICAIFKGAPEKVYVTPMSTFVDQVTKGFLKRNPGSTLNEAVTKANSLIRTMFNLINDVHSIQPASGPGAATTNPDAYRVAVILGGYSQLVKDYISRCGASVDVIDALTKDITDATFDGKNTAGIDGDASITCGGKTTALPTSAGTADLTNAINTYGTTASGQALDVGGQRALVDDIKTSVVVSPAAPSQVSTLPSQGLIAIDTKANIGYVPIYQLDATGNAQIAVVNLAVGAANPVLKQVSLPGATIALASNFNAADGKVYALAASASNALFVYVIRTSDFTVEAKISTDGLGFNGYYGAIIVDPDRKQVLVGGSTSLGLLDISGTTPVWLKDSIVNVSNTDSVTLNLSTGMAFVSEDGEMHVLDTTKRPLTAVQYGYDGLLGTTDGVAFDNLTGMLVVTPEFQDLAYAVNFAEYAGNGAVVPTFTVSGVGSTPPVGEGPGGQAAVNVLTHQAVIVDEFGHNIRLVQLPTTSITGAATAANAYTMAATVLPKATIKGVATQLAMRGDPNSLTVDPARNYAYMLADTQISYHTVSQSRSLPLYLVRVDLASATKGMGTTWAPSMQLIPMPGN